MLLDIRAAIAWCVLLEHTQDGKLITRIIETKSWWQVTSVVNNGSENRSLITQWKRPMNRRYSSPLVTGMNERQKHYLTIDIAGHQSLHRLMNAVRVCVNLETNNLDNKSKRLAYHMLAVDTVSRSKVNNSPENRNLVRETVLAKGYKERTKPRDFDLSRLLKYHLDTLSNKDPRSDQVKRLQPFKTTQGHQDTLLAMNPISVLFKKYLRTRTRK